MEKANQVEIESYEYPVDPGAPFSHWAGFLALEVAGPPESQRMTRQLKSEKASGEPSVPEGGREELEERMQRTFEAGRIRGMEDEQLAQRAELQAAQGDHVQELAQQTAEWIDKLCEERNQYLHAMEVEVVELALAITARILRREAQSDPLLLIGAVRVALGQLSETTQIRLKVPALDLELWKEAMDHLPNLPVHPTVLPGEGLQTGECRVETEIGSADVGIQTQLDVISRGFVEFQTSRQESLRSDASPNLPASERLS